MQSVLWAVIEMEKSVVGIQAKENYRAMHFQLNSSLLYKCFVGYVFFFCVLLIDLQLFLRVTRSGFVVSRGNQLILVIQAGDLWLVAKMGMQGSWTLHWRELLLSSVDTHELWPVSNGVVMELYTQGAFYNNLKCLLLVFYLVNMLLCVWQFPR